MEGDYIVLTNMNREQRRAKAKEDKKWLNEHSWRPELPEEDKLSLDFFGVSDVTLCESVQLLLNELKARGIPVRDWDNKDKIVKQIMIVRGRVYFLAEKGR